MKFLPFLTVFALGLVACTTPPAEPTPRMSSQGDLPAEWPRSPSLEAAWGKAHGPSLQLNGRQAITYHKPGERQCGVTIVYEGVTRPREIRDFSGKRASDGTLVIMGRQVDYYSSGNEEAAISTQPVQLASPGGWTAWYSFDFSCKEHLEGRNIPVFTW